MAEDRKLKGKRCIALARCSTAGQIDTSIDEQLNLIERFVRAHEMVLVDRITLGGVTGSVPGARSDIDTLIQRKRDHKDYEIVVVQDTTRLTRSGPAHGLHIIFQLRAVGVQVVFVKDQLPDGDIGDVMQTLQYYAAKEQSRSTAFTVTRGAIASLYHGKTPYCKAPPFAVDRLILSEDGRARHIIRNLPDGSQLRLDPTGVQVLERFAPNKKGESRCHYLKQKSERIELVPGDAEQVKVVMEIFDRHFRDAWGCHRIAKLLNSRGVPSPRNKTWSVRMIRSVLRNPIYLGVGMANLGTKAVYYMRSEAGPVEAETEMKDLADRKPPRRIRKRADWHEQEVPRLAELIDADIRELAREKQAKYLEKLATGIRTKSAADRHPESAYILKNLLVAKQGGHRMTGRATGRRKPRTRYYAISRAYSHPDGDRTRTRLIPAEPIEQAVLGVVKTILENTDLMEPVRKAVDCCRRAVGEEQSALPKLLEQRDAIDRQMEFVLSELDEVGRDALRNKMETLQNQRRAVNDQIRQMKVKSPAPKEDAAETALRIVSHLTDWGNSLEQLPPAALRRLLEILIDKAEVDLETRVVELSLRLPAWAVEHVEAMCPGSTLAYKPYPEAHPECGIVLVRTRLVWWPRSGKYIGHSFAA